MKEEEKKKTVYQNCFYYSVDELFCCSVLQSE